ncbi:MAG: cupin domain-containing protein, partial [Gammaproteobacteria bacterium]|nr:cupin domain-containing protein [Gammaproteobacteria bacterium]
YEGIIKPETQPKRELITTEHPFGIELNSSTQKSNISYQDESKNFTVGIWESEAFNSEPQTFPNNQFIYVLAGTLKLIDDEQQVELFKTGDALFIPESVSCGWQSSGSLDLLFTVVR